MSEPLIREGAIHGRSPADGSTLDPVPTTSTESIEARVGVARARGAELAAMDIQDRAYRLGLLKDAILARSAALEDALTRENGKPLQESWLHEILPTADLAAYWAKDGPEMLAPEKPVLDPVSYPGKKARVDRVARGVIGLITPWNFPVAIPLRSLFPALLAGNAVLWKPSEYTPRSAAILGEAIDEVYGEGLVHVLQGGGEVGAAIAASGVDGLLFTGSVNTGRKVARAAAEALIPVGLELGGKDAAIVLEDAPIERAANGILWGAIANAGQNCAAVERVIVVKSIAPTFIAALKAAAAELRPGVDYGPLVNEAQLAIVEKHVASARDAGATVALGGERLDRDGLWYPPTILTDVPHDAECVTEETFGPTIPVLVVDDEDSAVALANASRFGLTASVWTKGRRRGERVAARLRCGVAMVNNHGFTGSVPALPWTGVGETGYGVTNGPHALDVLTRPRATLIDGSGAAREMWWHPYTPGLEKVARGLAAVRGPAGALEKAKAVGGLLAGFASRWRVPGQPTSASGGDTSGDA